MKIAYATTYDALDRRKWSGLGHAIMHAFQLNGAETVPIGPLRTPLYGLRRLKRGLYKKLFGLFWDPERLVSVGKSFAKQIDASVAGQGFDAIVSPGVMPVAQLDTALPIVIWSDATFVCLVEHYGINVSKSGWRQALANEKAAFDRASLLVFASQWAADSAINDYGVDPAKVMVAPFGANFIHEPAPDAALSSVSKRSREVCELISIGVEWERKGMPKAIQLTEALISSGVPAHLTIVGCQPPPGTSVPDCVTLAGFISKREPDGDARLGALLAKSHFHVLFSNAEAFGVVFAEANAWAVPNITHDVGGIVTAVHNGVGGQRFAPAAEVSQIADFISNLFRDPDAYSAAATSARQDYESRLNWRVSAGTVCEKMESLMSTARQ